MTLSEKLLEVDWGLIILITLAACAGFAMLYSIAGGHLRPWAGPQIVRFAAGLLILVAAAMIDIRVWMGLAYPAYGVAFLLLLVVQSMGHVGLGAQRKISLVLALARYLHGLTEEDISRPVKLLVPLVMIAAPAVLVLLQPNLGTAIILVADGCSLLFLAGLSWRWIVPALGAVAASIPVAWEFMHDYQRQRVLTFLDPSSDALGAGWNITQAKIAIGSGGFSGKGFLQGTQSRLNFLPEKETDFIFTTLGEEFGCAGSIALLILFGLIIAYGIRIAMASRSQFGRLVAMGVTLNFFFYIMINGLMVMGLIPVVGIPMPLVSYGGSAMMTVMFGFGLLMSVHVHRQVEIPLRSAGLI
ncbi:MAG: rod shape-determining protein RodA [Alphaproteobacteria bacterium]|nr:rod shape-determining protein RodA [Alphaproteobacteria bacterium]